MHDATEGRPGCACRRHGQSDDPCRSHDRVDGTVVPVRGYRIKPLVVIDERADPGAGRDSGQRPVVRTSAAAQSMATVVDRQRRSQHRIGPGDRIGAEAWTDGLDQSTGSTGQCVVTGVDRPVQIVVRTQHRQQYPLAEIVEHPEQPSGAGLEADGDVARDNRGTHDLRGAQQPVGDGAGVVDQVPEAGVPGAGRGASSGALPSA